MATAGAIVASMAEAEADMSPAVETAVDARMQPIADVGQGP